MLIAFSLLINHLIYSTNKEDVFNTSSLFVIQKDSLSLDYKKAKQFYERQDYENSLKKALKIIEDNKNINSTEVILTNHLIANIFFASRNNKNAIKYYKRTIQFLTDFESDETTNLGKSIINFDKNKIYAESVLALGSSYYRLNFRDKLKKDKDSALYFYKELDKIGFSDDNILEVKSRAYTNLSVIYMNDSMYNVAKSYALKSINIHKSLNNKVNEAAALGNLSSIYLSEDNYDQAKKIYYEALDLIRNINTNKAIKVKEDLYFNLAYNLYKLKDYKAYAFQELSYNIKDSLRDKEYRGMITEITEKHNFDVKKNLLLKEEENKRLKDQRTFWILGIGSLIVIISLLYGLNFYKLRQKNLELQLSQTELIQNKNIEKIKSDSQVRILNATIDGKESERKQIAETLHDSVSALLSSANLHLQATRRQFNGTTPVEIDKTQEIITEASQKIRDLSHTLVSSVLLKFGLNYAVKDMADKYSNSEISIKTDVQDVRRYHQSFEIKVYNITQEFLNNILKHSKANNAIVHLKEVDNKLCIKISDDGIGFDKVKIGEKDGLGLNQIDARIQMMKGKFQIDSNPNEGTTISVELPILEKEAIIHV